MVEISKCLTIPQGTVASRVDAEVASPDADLSNSSWTVHTNFGTHLLRDVWGSGPNDMWAVGNFNSLLRWTGGPFWNVVSSPGNANWDSIWGNSSDNAWVAGSSTGNVASSLMRWDGSSGASEASPADSAGTGIWGLASGEAWLVGHSFNFHNFKPAPESAWEAVESFDLAYWPEDIWADSAPDSDLWVAGQDGISRWSNTDNSLITATVAAPSSLLAVWGLDASNVWTVGTAGTIMRWDGTSWETQQSSTSADLHAVWASSPTNAWAVGTGGTIVHWDGLAWQPVNSGTQLDLFGIWGFGAGDIWAVGSTDQGVILHFGPAL